MGFHPTQLLQNLNLPNFSYMKPYFPLAASDWLHDCFVLSHEGVSVSHYQVMPKCIPGAALFLNLDADWFPCTLAFSWNSICLTINIFIISFTNLVLCSLVLKRSFGKIQRITITTETSYTIPETLTIQFLNETVVRNSTASSSKIMKVSSCKLQKGSKRV